MADLDTLSEAAGFQFGHGSADRGRRARGAAGGVTAATRARKPLIQESGAILPTGRARDGLPGRSTENERSRPGGPAVRQAHPTTISAAQARADLRPK